MTMKVKEKGEVTLLKDYSRTGSGYVYWVEGQEGHKVSSYLEATEMFQKAIATTLEHQGGGCPECGGNLRQIGRGGKWNHRWVMTCDSCGWSDDAGTSQELINSACEAHGLVKRESRDSRDREAAHHHFYP